MRERELWKTSVSQDHLQELWEEESVCLSDCLSVCLSVCLSNKTFINKSNTQGPKSSDAKENKIKKNIQEYQQQWNANSNQKQNYHSRQQT